MSKSTMNQGSYWESIGTNRVSYPALAEDLVVDVAIIGAGIVGLTAAIQLCREGKSVVVLEALRVGTQVTARSTAKVTSQHGLVYARMMHELGEDNARLYAQFMQVAIERINKHLQTQITQ